MFVQASRRIFIGFLVAVLAFASAGTAVAKQRLFGIGLGLILVSRRRRANLLP